MGSALNLPVEDASVSVAAQNLAIRPARECRVVNEKVSVLDTRSMTRLDETKVQEKWDGKPDQLADVLSLVGDASDNIPYSTVSALGLDYAESWN